MGISVVIAHYSSDENTHHYRNILKNTINSIRFQNIDFNLEVIICDDGSSWSSSLIDKDEHIVDISRIKIKENKILKDLNVDRYIYIKSINKFYKSRLLNYAYLNAKYSKIVTLDDDHAFVSKNALKKFDKYLDRFDYARGRIILGNGKPTTYFSKEVQGTTFGFMKDCYIRFGGYPKFLFADSIGDGNVMNWEFYRLISNKTGINACYAGDIITKDAASSRWKSINLTPESFSSRGIEFTNNFINNYEVNPWMNKGRKKYLWMQLSSFHALLYELYYLPIRLLLNLLEFILKFVSKVTKYIFMPQKLIHKVKK